MDKKLSVVGIQLEGGIVDIEAVDPEVLTMALSGLVRTFSVYPFEEFSISNRYRMKFVYSYVLLDDLKVAASKSVALSVLAKIRHRKSDFVGMCMGDSFEFARGKQCVSVSMDSINMINAVFGSASNNSRCTEKILGYDLELMDGSVQQRCRPTIKSKTLRLETCMGNWGVDIFHLNPSVVGGRMSLPGSHLSHDPKDRWEKEFFMQGALAVNARQVKGKVEILINGSSGSLTESPRKSFFEKFFVIE